MVQGEREAPYGRREGVSGPGRGSGSVNGLGTKRGSVDALLRRDDSMSLMRELVTHALDDGYAAAAARRAGGQRRSTRRGLGATLAALTLLGLLLSIAAVQKRQSAPAVAQEKAELVERIRAESARNDRLAARADALEEEVTVLQDSVLTSTASGQELRERLVMLEAHAETSRVAGPGIRIIVDDAPPDEVSGLVDEQGRILDIDLQQAVNGLWAAGAEAIAINGQRLTGLTAIRGANKSITVDYRPLARPYVIEAIGDPDSIEARFAENRGGAWLHDLQKKHGIRLEISSVDELTLPGKSGNQLRYARTEGA